MAGRKNPKRTKYTGEKRLPTLTTTILYTNNKCWLLLKNWDQKLSVEYIFHGGAIPRSA